ncbi:cytochrome c [Rhodobacteraceae bacterium KMM 6894]|nr:cytochrome c [Rhodobacteraceae bacterium KMM 6894]
MKWGTISLAVFAAVAGAWYVLQSGDATMSTETRGAAPLPGDAMVAVEVPASLSEQEQIGKRAYDAVCAFCHGENAQGKAGTAPPLVHKIYEPGHHGDMAFVLAAQNGVRAHHWKFGDMPAVKGVTQADLLNITAYVRALQRENGIE